MKIRSFLAFDISERLKSELASVITMLSGRSKEVKWVRPELMHCTLRFFGDVEEELLMGRLSDLILKEVLHQAPIHVVVNGIGVFPNWRYPRVVWAGISGDTESLISLHTRLEEVFEELGMAKDPRELRLHLTLGRARSPMKDCASFMQIVEKMADHQFGELYVKALTLYQSVLTREGPIYTPLRSFPLGGREAAAVK